MEEIEKTKKEESERETETMTENLERLLKEITPDETIFSEADLDLPVDQELETEGVTAAEEPVTEAITEQQTQVNKIPITNLESWFTAHANDIDNINNVIVQLRGVDSKKTLILSVKIPNGGVDEHGNERRFLKIFDNADITPVLNLPPVSMDIYNNGFRIVNQYDPTTFIKVYVSKMNIVCTLCTNVNGKLIPNSMIKVKKKETEVEIPTTVTPVNIQKLQETADLETVQLLYKQSVKYLDKFTTNLSVVEWFLERQDGILDINHHLQIDDVIIALLK
jgi:hypothetical protein